MPVPPRTVTPPAPFTASTTARPPVDAVAADDGNIFDTLLSGLGSNIYSSLLDVFLNPVAGWLATVLGISSNTPPLAGQVIELAQQVTNLSDQINVEYLQGILNTDATSLSLPCSNLSAWTNTFATEVGEEVWTTFNSSVAPNIGYLGTIGDTQSGLIGTSQGFLSTWIETYAPQFYIDSVQQAIIHDQYDYYLQAQFLAMQLQVEMYHLPSSAAATGLPSPPNYAAAVAAFNQYYTQAQQQLSLLPFQTSGLGYTVPPFALGCDQVIYDRVVSALSISGREPGARCWGYQNFGNGGSGQFTTVAEQHGLSSSGDLGAPLRLATLTELETLFAANSTGNLPAYERIVSGGGPPAPASPTTEQFLNAFGFDLALSTERLIPFMTAEALEPAAWFNAYTVWQCGHFYDLASGTQVKMSVFCHELLGDNPFDNLVSTNIASYMFQDGDGNILGAGSGGFNYCDALYIYYVQPTDPPIEEPQRIGVGGGPLNGARQPLTATGIFIRSTGVGLDITPYVSWNFPSLDSGAPPAMISYESGAAELVWLVTSSTFSDPLPVTAQRGALISPPTLFSAPQTLPPRTTQAVNIYPRDFNFNGTAPLSGQIYVQRLYSDGTTITDDFPNFTATADSDLLKFTNLQPSSGSPTGTFTINGPFNGTMTITVTDNTDPNNYDKVTFPVVVTGS